MHTKPRLPPPSQWLWFLAETGFHKIKLGSHYTNKPSLLRQCNRRCQLNGQWNIYLMIPKWSLLQIEAFTYFTQIYLRVLSSSINIAYVKCHFMLYCWRGSRCDAQNKMLRPTLFTVKKNFSLQLTAEIFSTGPSRFVWWHLKPSIEKVILNINIWYHWYHISLPGEFWYKFIFCV